MNLSISNIAWADENDNCVYSLMQKYGYTGLEIAPTRIFPENPYSNLIEAKNWSKKLASIHGFIVPSIQSIWYGRSEKIFGSSHEREALISYTKHAINFAEAIGCGNIVFGCPQNRSIPENEDLDIAVKFFKILGDYAFNHHTVIALEANPPIYNTNFINTTKDAIDFIEIVASKGFMLNLDLGTMIENNESIDVLEGKEYLINHVHISEPGLKRIQKRNIHKELADMLFNVNYGKFLSIEVRKQDNIDVIAHMMKYVKEVFE